MIKAKTSTGSPINIIFNVGDKVKRAILAVPRLAESNHKVVFDEMGEGLYIQNNITGQRCEMIKEASGDYVIEVDVEKYLMPF